MKNLPQKYDGKFNTAITIISAIFGIFTACSFIFLTSVLWVFFLAGPLASITSVAHDNRLVLWASIAFTLISNCILLNIAGSLYINLLSRIAFKFKRNVLGPLCWTSLSMWTMSFLSYFVVQLFIPPEDLIGNLFWATVLFGTSIFFHHRGMFKKAQSIRNEIDGLSEVKLTTPKFVEHINALKKAESIQQLEDLSKNCLIAMNIPINATTDNISSLVDELIKQNLINDANEISTIHLKLLEPKDSEQELKKMPVK